MSLGRARVYTPPSLAASMVKAISRSNSGRWLDPCIGQGAFLKAIAANGVRSSNVRGLDIDTKASRDDILCEALRGSDFIAWSMHTQERFDSIVANPPYVSIHDLPERLAPAIDKLRFDRLPLSRDANYWCAFVIQSLAVLSKGGHVSIVLPASWEYANYAANMRSTVPLLFGSFEVHRSLAPLFGDVQEGAVVIVGRNFGCPHRETCHYEYPTPSAMIAALTGEVDMSLHLKLREVNVHFAHASIQRLSEVADVWLGAVTGDARYFLMTEGRRQELELPFAAMRPALTHAKDLVASRIEASHWQELKDRQRRIWLFRPTDNQLNVPAVRRYLDLPEKLGGCNRVAFKVSTRDPWHRTRLPADVHAFMSGMSHRGPWLALNSMRFLTASNTLYVAAFRSANGVGERSAWALSFLSSEVRSQLRALGRRYPDGLLKYEPGDLADVRLPTPPATAGAEVAYDSAVQMLLSEGEKAAAGLADRWLSGIPVSSLR